MAHGSGSVSTRPLRIGIDAAMDGGGNPGGITQATIALISALGKLSDGDETYVILALPGHDDWIKPYLGPNQLIQPYPTEESGHRARWLLRRIANGRFGRVAKDRIRRTLFPAATNGVLVSGPPASPGFLESLGLNIMHFPWQQFVRTAIPTLFNPWDLQHLHYPYLLPIEEVTRRMLYYALACREATCIAVASQWGKEDFVNKLGLPPQKVRVVPLAAPTVAYAQPNAEDKRRVRATYALPDRFAFYPAQTYSHKNHLRLFEALVLLRDDHGVHLSLVCTGFQNDHSVALNEAISRLGLADQVHMLGYIPADHVRALYRLAEVTVFPTIFEGAGLPLLEAFAEGCPLACSRLPVLVEQAGNAALYFDPFDSEDIARALLRLHADVDLRDALRTRGGERVRLYSGESSARTYRALYRMLGGRALNDSDHTLLVAAEGGWADTVACRSLSSPLSSGHCRS